MEEAVSNGQRVFGIDVPLRDRDLRVPGFKDAGDNANFIPGGRTAVEVPGGFLETGVREAVVAGGGRMPRGTILFELLPDGTREIVRVFN